MTVSWASPTQMSLCIKRLAEMPGWALSPTLNGEIKLRIAFLYI
jgi:hypothetical protein